MFERGRIFFFSKDQVKNSHCLVCTIFLLHVSTNEHLGCFPSFATTKSTVYSCPFKTLTSVSSTLVLRSHALLFLFQHHKIQMVFIYCLIFKIFFIYSLRILYKYAMNLVTPIIYSPIHFHKMFYHILLPTFLSFFLTYRI